MKPALIVGGTIGIVYNWEKDIKKIVSEIR